MTFGLIIVAVVVLAAMVALLARADVRRGRQSAKAAPAGGGDASLVPVASLIFPAPTDSGRHGDEDSCLGSACDGGAGDGGG